MKGSAMARTTTKRPRGRPRKTSPENSVVSPKNSPKRQPVVREPVPREPVAREPVVATRDVEKKVDDLIATIRKEFGAESIGRLGEYETDVQTFPSGSEQLDKAIGVGGFPLAKLVQITGGESVGKSTLVNYIAATAQRQGVIVYFLDGEMSEGNDRAAAIGVNTNLLPISEPETLEDAFARINSAVERMKRWNSPALIILDSVAALPMRVDITRAFDEESRRAARAIFLSGNLPKLIAPLKGTKIGLIFVNQLREKANVTNPYEKKTYPPGGYALKHWCHLTLELTRFGTVKQSGEAVACTTRILVVKSKIAPPLKTAMVNLYFNGRVEDTHD
jgi:recombination protein RecA